MKPETEIEIAVLREAVKLHCSECRDFEPPVYDAGLNYHYHQDGALGCTASRLHKMIEARTQTSPERAKETEK